MEQNPTTDGLQNETRSTTDADKSGFADRPRLSEKSSFTMASILKKEGRWKVLGITIEAWVVAFLIALALPYINIVAIPVMFFVFAGALAIYTVWALFKLV